MQRKNASVRQKRRSQSLVIFIIVAFIGFSLVNIHLVVHLDSIHSGTVDYKKNIAQGRTNNAIINYNITYADKIPIIKYFHLAGVELDDESIKLLPTWSQIESIIGNEPVIHGLEKCEEYKNNVPALRRMLGSAGMFNSGTNLVTRLMKENCVIPQRYNHALKLYGQKATKEQFGIRWQCPWGKHTPVKFKYNHTAPKNENVTKDDCLPVVTIRNPYDWMKSMCKISYTARWNQRERGKEICPHLVYDRTSNPDKMIKVGLKAKLAEQWLNYDSLAHLWNDWYADYWKDFDFPFLMVRLEDLILRQYNTTKIICNCAGGVVPKESNFKFQIESAKHGPGHGPKEERTDLVKAWIKYGKQMDAKAGFSDADWEASKEFLDVDLMEMMQYKYPPE